MRRALALVWTVVACAGEGEAAPDAPLWVVVDAEPGVDVAAAELVPPVAERQRVEVRPGVWAIGVEPRDGARALTVRAPGACPADVREASGGARRVRLRAFLSVDEPVAQVGWDAQARIEVRPGCREALAGRVEWTQVGGPRLAALATARNGFVVNARTPPFEGEVPWGVVPVSPRTRGEVVLEARWRGSSGPEVRRRVRIAAGPRATGLPSVPVGGQVLLGGRGWTIVEPPRGARAELAPGAEVTSFVPDVVGTWRLRDADDRELMLRAGRYDDTPLDCGRSECHASAAEHARTSPMTSVLARGLMGELGDGYDPTCAAGCHSVGEPGLPDGGFAHVARAGGFALGQATSDAAWDRLPVALQRLSGVGCLACHGPGAIPAPEARWAILRSDVCATCHDAPPRYGHVAAWRASRMARADAHPRTTADATCRGCHTTSGFLARVGVREEQPVPDGVGPLGVACAACHAPHGDHVGVALLRATPVPSSLAGSAAQVPAKSRVCVSCHAPDGEGLPAASAASLWLASSEHADVDGGCVGCHRAGPDDLERGASHRFAADPTACAPCHEGDAVAEARAQSAELQERARSLWDALVARGAVRVADGEQGDPVHARTPTVADPDSPEGRAARDVALVLEDPAAGAHGPARARSLLDRAASAPSLDAAR